MTLNKKWSYELTEKAEREFGKLDKPIQKQIIHYFDSIVKTPNPRVKGSALKGTLRSYWRYRVGDYLILCQFKDDILTIHIIKIAHRREVYKRT
jgi:mRNA interferase RelE/StbE